MAGWFPELKKREYTSGAELVCRTRPNGSSTNWTQFVSRKRHVYEEILSQCHTGYWRGADTVGDVGGEMRLYRKITDHVLTWNGGGPSAIFDGDVRFGFFTGADTVFGPGSQGHNDTALKAFGTLAISETAPTNPAFSIATALGELKKDGLPHLPELLKDRTDLARKSGSDYLNIEFGWLPLIRDVKDFAYAVKNSRFILDQYIRDSGRRVRRRFSRPPIIDTAPTQYSGGFVAPTTVNWSGQGTLDESRETWYWFSGAFVYHIPADDTFIGEFRRMESLANHLLGTRLTPAVLWELAPWSWASDWFLNIGELLNNISVLGTDGLVLHHGYAMRQQTVTSKYRLWTTPSGQIGKGTSVLVGDDIITQYKRRVRANPYGFNVDFEGLSGRQLAILAALGLSRGRRDGNRHPEP